MDSEECDEGTPLLGPGGAGAAPEGWRRVRVAQEHVNAFSDNHITTAKYSVITFLPLYLWEQFKRVANVYFLLVSALQLIPKLSPTGRFTTLATLVVVLAINAVKEAWEDYKRHVQDKEVNERSAVVLRHEEWCAVQWNEVQVGDVLRIRGNEAVPADCVIVLTSHSDGLAYVETSSLDGETNLKVRLCAPYVRVKEHSLSRWNAVVHVEQPHKEIDRFKGTLERPDGLRVPLGDSNVLLRGSTVQNTKWVCAVAVYCGSDTKLALNSTKPPYKCSNVERKTNKYIWMMFLLLLIMSVTSSFVSAFWMSRSGGLHAKWYLLLTRSAVQQALLNFVTFFILFYNMIPISLYVTIEIVKLWQGLFINWDERMCYKGTYARARTSTLNEELGQIRYVFSDKTGTLTQNQMQFRKCVINGHLYGKGYTQIALSNMKRRKQTHLIDESLLVNDEDLEDVYVNFDDERLLSIVDDDQHSEWNAVTAFLLCLSLCHTIIPETEVDPDSGEERIHYQSASPDETALVRAALHFGYELVERSTDSVTIRKPDGSCVTYEVLNVLEFNSDRKRMSVIVRDEQHRLWLLCKGADSALEPLLVDADCDEVTRTMGHLSQLGSEGLRTLLLAHKYIDEEEYAQWNALMEEATLSVNRDVEVDRVSALMEVGLSCIGATAIEDKLQDGVPTAIEKLRAMGVKTWVLTGDKQETAINVGFACSLLDDDMDRIVVNIETPQECERRFRDVLQTYDDVEQDSDHLALIIDGSSLTHALSDLCEQLFIDFALKCRSVIVCRASPAQKADVVELIKASQKAITLAIGDGANDVSMIQSAHVGIGISGEEGLQAARSADYSISQFRFLIPLMLIHGRYSYRRISKLIQYSFYKNLLLVLSQYWFTVFNGWSGQSLYEQWTLGVYNVVFTSLPVITFAILDWDISPDIVMMNPQLYRGGQQNILFTRKRFLQWMANAIWHSLVVFFVCAGCVHGGDVMSRDGKALGLWGFGVIVYTSVVFTVTLKIALESRRWVWYHTVVVCVSALSFPLWCIVYQYAYSFSSFGPEMYLVYNVLLRAPAYYLTVCISCAMAVWHNVTWMYVKRNFFPKEYHIVQEMELKGRSRIRLGPQGEPRWTPWSHRAPNEQRAHTGYAFSAPVTSHDLQAQPLLRPYDDRHLSGPTPLLPAHTPLL